MEAAESDGNFNVLTRWRGLKDRGKAAIGLDVAGDIAPPPQ